MDDYAEPVPLCLVGVHLILPSLNCPVSKLPGRTDTARTTMRMAEHRAWRKSRETARTNMTATPLLLSDNPVECMLDDLISVSFVEASA